MFGYTVFLKIGNLAASSLTDMYKDSYQLIGCEFGFAQGIDIKGQAQTEVKRRHVLCDLPSSSQP